jgi:hypothetical protein
MTKIIGDKLVVNLSECRIKKVGGHAFVELLGLNKFKKIGDAMLELHGLIKSDIDPKWLKRGDFAEKVVQHCYKRDGFKITIYDKKEVKYDNFQDNDFFGGLIDIELLENEEIVEVKSKSMSAYNFIEKDLPIDEVYQGMLYAYNRNYKSFRMEWIFFDEETEKEIFEDKKPTTLKYLKKISKRFRVSETDMKDKTEKVKKLVSDFRFTGEIPLSEVSDEALEKLGLSRYNSFDDLQF